MTDISWIMTFVVVSISIRNTNVISIKVVLISWYYCYVITCVGNRPSYNMCEPMIWLRVRTKSYIPKRSLVFISIIFQTIIHRLIICIRICATGYPWRVGAFEMFMFRVEYILLKYTLQWRYMYTCLLIHAITSHHINDHILILGREMFHFGLLDHPRVASTGWWCTTRDPYKTYKTYTQSSSYNISVFRSSFSMPT